MPAPFVGGPKSNHVYGNSLSRLPPSHNGYWNTVNLLGSEKIVEVIATT